MQNLLAFLSGILYSFSLSPFYSFAPFVSALSWKNSWSHPPQTLTQCPHTSCFYWEQPPLWALQSQTFLAQAGNKMVFSSWLNNGFTFGAGAAVFLDDFLVLVGISSSSTARVGCLLTTKPDFLFLSDFSDDFFFAFSAAKKRVQTKFKKMLFT